MGRAPSHAPQGVALQAIEIILPANGDDLLAVPLAQAPADVADIDAGQLSDQYFTV